MQWALLRGANGTGRCVNMHDPSIRLFSHLTFLWPVLAACSAGEFATALAKNWTDLTLGHDDEETPAAAWTTGNSVALELTTVRLRNFSLTTDGIPVLLCAPFALHRATVVDLAPDHSLVAALRVSGINRLFVTDWRSATSEMRFFGIDDYLAALNVVVDELGGCADLVGLCQGGWLSLLYAARFPSKVRKLVIAGAPVDIAAGPSNLSTIVDINPFGMFEELVRVGEGRVLGEKVLGLWGPVFVSDDEVHRLLQTHHSRETRAFSALAEVYRHWHVSTVDLPGTYYLEVIDKLYRHNALAKGRFVALGQTIDLSRLTMPLYLLAATDDEVVSPAQLMALEHLVGTPADQIVTAHAPCRHLSLFMGEDTLKRFWPTIARWLIAPEAATASGTSGDSMH